MQLGHETLIFRRSQARGDSTRLLVEDHFKTRGITQTNLKKAQNFFKDKLHKQTIKKTLDERPTFFVNDKQEITLINEVWSALLANNNHGLYRKDNSLAQILTLSSKKSIRTLDDNTLHGYLIRAANWFRSCNGKSLHASPTAELTTDMLNNPHGGIPRLKKVAHAPYLAASGQLIFNAGYNPETEIYLDPPINLDLSSFSLNPTNKVVEESLNLFFDDLLVDFPFDDDNNSSLANMLCCLLLPFVRPYIAGPIPAVLIEAPTAGSGKGYLAQIIGIITEGQPASVHPLSKDEAESRKKITALLMSNPNLVVFDNVNFIDCPYFCALLTALTTWSDRPLGTSKIIEASVENVMWVFTGNNVEVSEEISRRIIPIRIVPDCDRPSERTAFKHPRIIKWATENRGNLVTGLLNIIQFWVNNGKKLKTDETMGSFEDFFAVMGGILECAGVHGFMTNRHKFRGINDSTAADWKLFVDVWFCLYQLNDVETGKLYNIAEQQEVFSYLRKDGDKNGKIKFGKLLGKNRGKVVSGYRIELSKERGVKGRLTYRLQPVTATKPTGTETSLAGVDTPTNNSGATPARDKPLKPLKEENICRSAGVESDLKRGKHIISENIFPIEDRPIHLGTPATPATPAIEVVSTAPNVKLITSATDLSRLANLIHQAGTVAFDLETTGLDAILDKPRLAPFALPDGSVYVVDLFATGGLGMVV